MNQEDEEDYDDEEGYEEIDHDDNEDEPARFPNKPVVKKPNTQRLPRKHHFRKSTRYFVLWLNLDMNMIFFNQRNYRPQVNFSDRCNINKFNI